MLVQPLVGIGHDEIVAIVNSLGGEPANEASASSTVAFHYIAQLDLGLIPPQELRIVIMCVDLVQVAVEMIEALFVRQPTCRAAHIAQSPFATEGRLVAGFLHHFGNGDVPIAKGLDFHSSAGVAANERMTRMLAGHQDATRRSTNGGTSIELRELQSLTSHLVQPWRLDLALSVAAQITIAQIVGHDPNDVGLRSVDSSGRETNRQTSEEQNAFHDNGSG